jgi:hypothetical protein
MLTWLQELMKWQAKKLIGTKLHESTIMRQYGQLFSTRSYTLMRFITLIIPWNGLLE